MPSTSVCTALSVYPQKGEIVPRRCAAIFVADRTRREGKTDDGNCGEGHRFLVVVVVFFSFFTRAEDAFDVEFCVCTREKTIVPLRGAGRVSDTVEQTTLPVYFSGDRSSAVRLGVVVSVLFLTELIWRGRYRQCTYPIEPADCRCVLRHPRTSEGHEYLSQLPAISTEV